MKTNFRLPTQQPQAAPAAPVSNTQQTSQTQANNQTPTETPRQHHQHGAFSGGGMHRGMLFKHGPKRHQPPSRGRNGPKARVRRAGARATQMGHEDDEHHGLHPDDLKEMLDDAWAHVGADADAAHQEDARQAMARQQQQQRPPNDNEQPLPNCKPVSSFRPKPPSNESLSKKNWSGADLLFGPKAGKQIPQRDLDLALGHVYFGITQEKALPMQGMATSHKTMALHAAMAAYLDRSAPRHEPPTLAEAKGIAMEIFPRGATRRPNSEQEQNAFLGFIPFMMMAMRRRTPLELRIAKAGLQNGKSASQLRMPKTPMPPKDGKPS